MKGQDILNTFPKIESYIFSSIIEAEQKKDVSYASILEEILKIPTKHYFTCQENGLLEYHNRFYKHKKFMNDYEKDFSGKSDYEKLSEENKVEVVGHVLYNFLKELKHKEELEAMED